MKLKLSQFGACVSIVCCMSSFAEKCYGDAPPPIMQSVVKNALNKVKIKLLHLDSILNSNDAGLIKTIAKEKQDYFLQLQTNWSVTLRLPPHALPINIRAYHEVLQFYFEGRTNYEEASLPTLLNGTFPQHLNWNKTDISKSDWNRYELVGLHLRVCWFGLFFQLNPKDILENHDPEMDAVLIASQYMDDFRQDPILYQLITATEFNEIMNLANIMPEFTDDYVARMAKLHGQQVEKSGIFPTALENLKSITGQYNASEKLMYVSAWREAPALFETRMLALEAWINNELEYLTSVVDPADKSKDGKSTLAKHSLDFANQALMEISNANIPQTNHIQANLIPKLTEQNLDLVRELNKYLRYRGRSFDVDYVSKSSAALAALQTGGQKNAVVGIQPDDASENLTLPIAILADYAKHSSNDAFKADLELIRARLEGLRDRASKMVTQ